MKKRISAYLVFGMLLGVLSIGSTVAIAASGANQPQNPKQIAAAVVDGATISFYDADGNLIWSSEEGVAPDASILSQVARVVITNADGEVVEDLATVVGPKGMPVVIIDGRRVSLGILLNEAGYAPQMNGQGARNQVRNQNQVQNRPQKRIRNGAPGANQPGQNAANGSGKQMPKPGQRGNNCNCQQDTTNGN